MDRLSMRVAIITLGFMYLQACAPSDNSPAAFKSKTGIPLCAEARVERVGANDPKLVAGFDEIYLARLQMSTTCARQLMKDLERASGASCDSSESCQVTTRRGFTVSVQKENGYYMISSVG